MLTIFLGGSLFIIVVLTVQKWVRLKRASMWPSNVEFKGFLGGDAKLTPVVDFVCGHLYNRRVRAVCQQVFEATSSQTVRAQALVSGRVRKAQRSFDDLLKGKNNLKHAGPASFFLKRISEHKKSRRDSE